MSILLTFSITPALRGLCTVYLSPICIWTQSHPVHFSRHFNDLLCIVYRHLAITVEITQLNLSHNLLQNSTNSITGRNFLLHDPICPSTIARYSHHLVFIGSWFQSLHEYQDTWVLKSLTIYKHILPYISNHLRWLTHNKLYNNYTKLTCISKGSHVSQTRPKLTSNQELP